MPQTPVIPAENAKNSDNRTKEPAFSALPYYKAALAIIASNPRLTAWKIASDVFSRLTTGLIGIIFLVSFGTAIFTAPDIFQRPAFIAGITGTAFVLWLCTLTFNTFAHSGIYATLNHILKTSHTSDPQSDEPQTTPSFFTSALERLDATLGLQLISLAARTTLGLLAAALAIGLFSSFPLHAADYYGSTKTTIIWALGIALYMVFTLLVRLAIELIAAPLFLEDRSLSDAILHAADFVLEYPLQLYRIFISMLSVTLIPMGIYIILLLSQSAILMFAPPAAPVGTAIRLFADFFLFISLACVAVIFYSAVFAFYGERRALWTTSDLEDFMHNPKNSSPGFLSSLFEPAKKPQKAPTSDFSEGATLETLTPPENPNIVTFDKIFEPDVLAHFTQSTRKDDDHEEEQTSSPDDQNNPEDDTDPLTPQND